MLWRGEEGLSGRNRGSVVLPPTATSRAGAGVKGSEWYKASSRARSAHEPDWLAWIRFDDKEPLDSQQHLVLPRAWSHCLEQATQHPPDPALAITVHPKRLPALEVEPGWQPFPPHVSVSSFGNKEPRMRCVPIQPQTPSHSYPISPHLTAQMRAQQETAKLICQSC